jgi:hypothetical protein
MSDFSTVIVSKDESFGVGSSIPHEVIPQTIVATVSAQVVMCFFFIVF